MRAAILLILSLCPTLVGCAVVRASADVVGAAGNLAAATAKTTAGVVRGAADAGSNTTKSSKKCEDGDKDCK